MEKQKMDYTMNKIVYQEVLDERSAICEFDGLLTREEAERQGLLESERYLADCEVRHVLRLDFSKRKAYLDLVEVKRGLKPANELRDTVRKEWLRRKALERIK
jgi:hypothetical protein